MTRRGRARLLESPAEDDQVLCDKCVHEDDENQRDNECNNRVHQINDVHEPIIVGEQFAYRLVSRTLRYAGCKQRVDVTGECYRA